MLPPLLAEVSRVALSVAMTFALGGGAETKHEGLRISIDVRDADATQIALAIVEGAGRQAVAAPAGSCRLTLKLRGVHWRTAIDHVLKPCGLAVDSDSEDDVLLIAPLSTLTERARQTRALAEARRAGPTKREIVSVRLSYARAEEMAEIVRRTLPPGAEVSVDSRTNTLIIVR